MSLKNEASKPPIGFETKKMLQAAIKDLRDGKNANIVDAPPSFLAPEYEDNLDKGAERSNTDGKIKDLLENLKQQMRDYDAKTAAGKKKTFSSGTSSHQA